MQEHSPGGLGGTLIFSYIRRLGLNIFWVLEIPDIFGVKGRCRVGASLCMQKKIETPLPGNTQASQKSGV